MRARSARGRAPPRRRPSFSAWPSHSLVDTKIEAAMMTSPRALVMGRERRSFRAGVRAEVAEQFRRGDRSIRQVCHGAGHCEVVGAALSEVRRFCRLQMW